MMGYVEVEETYTWDTNEDYWNWAQSILKRAKELTEAKCPVQEMRFTHVTCWLVYFKKVSS